MISNTEEALPAHSDVAASECRRLCTVDQVEQLKSTIRILPIWSSTVFLAQAMSQNYAVLQANEMDRRVGVGRFRVQGCSLTMFNMVTMSLWSGSYDRWIAPALQRITGDPRGLTMKQRIGAGLVLATAGMAVSAVVEGARRRLALMGLAEAFGVIGELEFFYTELPKSMASFSMALLYMAMGVGNLVNSLIVKVVHEASRRGGRTSWLSSDLNLGHYDYYYWLLACLGALNFVYFLCCGWAYGEEGKNVEWEEEAGTERPMA